MGEQEKLESEQKYLFLRLTEIVKRNIIYSFITIYLQMYLQIFHTRIHIYRRAGKICKPFIVSQLFFQYLVEAINLLKICELSIFCFIQKEIVALYIYSPPRYNRNVQDVIFFNKQNIYYINDSSLLASFIEMLQNKTSPSFLLYPDRQWC